MMYVFFGSDTVGVREKAFATVEQFQSEGYRIEKIEAESYQYGMLQDAAGAASLFGEKSLFVVDNPKNNEECTNDLALVLPELPESENAFIVIEGTLTASEKKQYEKYAVEVVEVKGQPKERFNAFVLGDALLRKDKRSLFVLFHEAVRSGLSPEEIIGVLWWQLKTLRLASLKNTPEEAGMKAYPFKKAKSALGSFKPGEVDRLSEEVLTLYHEGHAGRRDIDLALERFILTL